MCDTNTTDKSNDNVVDLEQVKTDKKVNDYINDLISFLDKLNWR